MKLYGLAMMAVTELMVTVVALLLAGRWIDQRYGFESRFAAIGAVAGCILGFTRLILRLQKAVNQPDEPEDPKNDNPKGKSGNA